MKVKAWLSAFRLRTLPLAVSSILMGVVIAAHYGTINVSVLVLSITTTIFLQILSNLANDYGDTQNGADHAERKGPSRAVQTGAISLQAMRKAMIIFIVLSLVSGSWLLIEAFSVAQLPYIGGFFILGVLSIIAAIKYTAGANPYGYAGLGDISVFVFFGLVGVVGSAYLHIQEFHWQMLLPASSLGVFATGVLNINNIRDIESDKKAGKYSIPVRIGDHKARLYHLLLLVIGWGAIVMYTLLSASDWHDWLFVISSPLFIMNGIKVSKLPNDRLDPFLKQMALSTLAFVVLNLFSI